MRSEQLAKLQADLGNAREGYRQASYIDSFPRMQREQARWMAEIDRIKAQIAALEAQP